MGEDVLALAFVASFFQILDDLVSRMEQPSLSGVAGHCAAVIGCWTFSECAKAVPYAESPMSRTDHDCKS